MLFARSSLPAIAALSLFFIAITATVGIAQAQPSTKPNIVIILVDDAALMDFGVYGGEASTPNIDALARRGAMFTQYRSSPLCSPSRAMLLTGVDNHRTGVATIPEVLPDEQAGQPGYSMALEPGVLTIADRLRVEGYRTLMVGKWHMGKKPTEMPQAHGFDRSFALAASGADNWEDKSYIPFYAEAPWFEDGVEAVLPDDFYSSEFIVDRMIDYLETTDSQKPFLAYLPFQAIHIPVQAPPEFISKYDSRYNSGWHALREERHGKAIELGLIPRGSALADLPPDLRQWDDLSEQERALYAARMAVNAAMLDAMDHYIGRFIDHLKATGQYEDTIFVVTSDNGPEPSRGDNNAALAIYLQLTGYNTGLENLGGQGSWGFIGPEWASAAATPGAWYKFYATEGGIRVPLIVAGPGLEAARIDSPAMVTDIAPTLLDWVGARGAPEDATPMSGRSLLAVLRGEAESAYDDGDIRAIEVSGNSAIFKGDYKITRSMPPVGDGNWRLFNLSLDPGETTDLSETKPAVLDDLLNEYEAYTKEAGVIEMPEGYDTVSQIRSNTTARMLENYPWLYLVLVGIVGALFLTAWMAWRGVRRIRGNHSAP
ncbi:sulfatase-like hydrolase/transferase [Erythrobacter sp. Alg231-14]|uniref:sulfatase-like hydrolase/transferase n=1 Tax=Erythrobacter sp. Alg231-14 TaxID=1922225 RepID=UPI000D54DEE9